ncbi:glycosyltransferase [Flammeovirgaceae bacterium 311]|nr:glycosyltransferase [Flammeovirgaceae bacterium 311]
MLPKDVTYANVQLPYLQTNPRALWKNIQAAYRQKSAVNHITGDIHYIAIALPRHNTILTIHDLRILDLVSPLKKRLIQLLWFTLPAHTVKYITVISEATKSELVNRIGVAASKIKVIPNPVAASYIFVPKFFYQVNPSILHLGTKENKNLDRLITAVAEINCHLRIIGKLNSQQHELLEKYTISYSNTWDLSLEQIVKEYQQADIVSFVSLYEGFGMPIVEAQATGRPVITSNCSSMPEVAGEGALLIDPTSVEEIRRGIIRLIEDEGLRNSLIQKGLENVKRFDAKVIAAQYAELYRKIAAEA